VANDIAMPGRDENGDERLPVATALQMAALRRLVRSELPTIRAPVIVFRSGTDHVIPGANARKVLDRIGSERTELVDCPRSFHVVTLDHDAPLVRDRLLAFVGERDRAAGRS
jgi:carboxylesterase